MHLTTKQTTKTTSCWILLIGATALLCSNLIISSRVSADSFEGDPDYGNDDEAGDGSFRDTQSFQFLGLTIDRSDKSTVRRDDFRTNRNFIGYKVMIHENETVATIKGFEEERLESCDKYVLLKPEVQKMIDCRTKEELVLDSRIPGATTTTSDNGDRFVEVEKFVVVAGTRHKLNLVNKGVYDYKFEWFPIRRDIVAGKISDILEANNLTAFPNATNLGFYVETVFQNTDDIQVHCLAELYATFNASEPLEVGARPFFRINDRELEDAWANGFLLSIEEFKCADLSTPIFDLRFKLTAFKRQEFPYFKWDSRLWIDPTKFLLLDFNATLEQNVNTPNIGEHYPYLTMLNVSSISSIIPFMNFQYQKGSLQTTEADGVGISSFVLASHLYSVQTIWAENFFSLSANISSIDFDEIKRANIKDGSVGLKKVGTVTYLDTFKSNFGTFSFDLEKSFFRSILDQFSAALPGRNSKGRSDSSSGGGGKGGARNSATKTKDEHEFLQKYQELQQMKRQLNLREEL